MRKPFISVKYKKFRSWIGIVFIMIMAAVGTGLMLKPKTIDIDESKQIANFVEDTINEEEAKQEVKQDEKQDENQEVLLAYNNTYEKAGVSAEKETAAIKALREIYGNHDEAIVIYEQKPFDDDYVLVLADRMTDGEHYPNLFLVNSNGAVSDYTRHSNCWTLNFTELGGYKIFFGLAGKEIDQNHDNTISVNKIEAIYENQIEWVEPRKNAYDYYNLDENGMGAISEVNGYILITKNPGMPEDVIGVTADGHKVSLSQEVINRNLSHMPSYLDSTDQSIYNSFAFTYSPMISPGYWEQMNLGEVGLKGRTDGKGNLNAISLRPSQTVIKTIHSSKVPNDIKSFYLSNSYPWTATFDAGESVEVEYSSDTELYDCLVFKLTLKSVDKTIESNELQHLSITGQNRMNLPKESGYYLVLLRTAKNFELRSYMGVIHIV